MSQFERDLREFLKRREAPSGFADKVIAGAQASDRRGWIWRWAAIAAMVAVMIGGSLLYRDHQSQVERERLKGELMFALRLTESKLRLVQERLSAAQQRTIQLPLDQ